MTKGRFFIGELAKKTRVNPKTIRYYEELGLLSKPVRSESGYRSYGYRLYSQEAIERLNFIHKAKGLGLSLSEIKKIIKISESGETPCPHTLALIDRKIEDLEQKIHELTSLRVELLQLKERWKDHYPNKESCKEGICPLIEGVDTDRDKGK